MAAKIGTTSRGGLSVEQVGGNDVYKMLAQIQAVLASLGDEYVDLFAEPVDAGRDIDWYPRVDGKVESVRGLQESGRNEELNRGLAELERLASGIKAYAAELHASSNANSRNYGDILQKALSQPKEKQEDYTFFINGQPVLIGWGFSDGNNDLVEGVRDLIKRTAAKLKEQTPPPPTPQPEPHPDSVPEPQPAPQPEPQPAPQPASQPEPQPASQPEPQPVPQQPPAGGAPASGNMSWLPAVLVGAGLLAAGAVAAWYFLHKKPEAETSSPDGASFAFLRGELNARGVLVNESGDPVDLRIQFKGDDGKGDVAVVEKNQTCHGATEARLGPGNTVIFDIPPIQCPNKNNYEPLSFQCIRGENSCTVTDDEGKTWKLNLEK